MHLFYQLHKIPKGDFFQILLTVKTSEGILSADKRGSCNLQDKKILDLVIKDFNTHKTLKQSNLEYGKFEKVPVSFHATTLLFTELAKVKEVQFENKKIVIDALSSARLFFEITSDDHQAIITSSVIDGTKAYPIQEIEAYLGDDPVWLFHKGVIKKLKTEAKWLKLARSNEVITGKKLEDLFDHYENELPLDQSVPDAKFIKEKSKTISPNPIIFLKNERGLFFDLKFDYPGHGEFAFLDLKNTFLNKSDEEFWEAELLSSNVKKSGKEYFVSAIEQEKVFKKLSSSGFSIKSYNLKEVVFLSEISGDLKTFDEGCFVDLIATFDDEEAELGGLAESAFKKTPFVTLKNQKLGMLPLSVLSDLEIFFKASRSQNKLEFDFKKKGDAFLKSLNIKEHQSLNLDALKFDYFNLSLLEFQKHGVSWLVTQMKQNGSCLLADDMGLGKTIQILALVDLIKTQLEKGVLIICPKSIKLQWQKAFREYLKDIPINYEIKSFHEIRQLDKMPSYSLCVVDEAQSIKNMKTLTFQKVSSVEANYKIALTGTPIENAFSDLVSLFEFLDPSILEDLKSVSLDQNQMKIKRRLNPFILRRTKKEVLKDLPPLFEQESSIEMTELQKDLYFGLIQKARTENIHAFSLLTNLRLLSLDARLYDKESQDVSHKTQQILEDLDSITTSGSKVILFSQFTSYLSLIKGHLEELSIPYAYIDGSVNNRDLVIEEFSKDKMVLLMSLKAGGVGLNLQMADYVLIADPWWNEAAEMQAIARAYRLGRSGSVVARRYITEGSLEEKIRDLKATKLELLNNLEGDGKTIPEEVFSLLFS